MDRERPTIQLPYLCNDELSCSPIDFLRWPQQNGWEWTPDLPISVFAIRVQAWLFFGLLNAYLHDDIPRETLVKHDPSNGDTLTFENLSALIFVPELSLAAENLEPISHTTFDTVAVPQQPTRIEALNCAVRALNNVLIPYLNGQDEETDLWTSKAHTTVLAVDMLIDQLLGPLYMNYNPPLQHCRRCPAFEIRGFRESATQAGLCRSLAWRLRPTSSKWYSLLMSKENPNPLDHSTCGTKLCHHHDINVATYKTQHDRACSGCDFVSSDEIVLKNIIEQDRIPLIRYYKGVNGLLRFEVISGDITFDYIAISHVWSGGLGNFDQNAIPQCQATKLKAQLERIPVLRIHHNEGFYPEWLFYAVRSAASFHRSYPRNCQPLFWLDTLCIPVSPNLCSYRRKAIDCMAQIYAGASSVLVLDPEIQQCMGSKVSGPDEAATMTSSWVAKSWRFRDEILRLPGSAETQIMISPWMSRSWPLQEGVTSKNLFFQLKDGPYYISPRQRKDIGFPDLRQFRRTRHEEAESYRRFNHVWNSLTSRATTQPGDLHGIIAALINLSAGEILSLPEPERMKAIIAAQEEVPLALLYERDQPSTPTNAVRPSWLPQFPSPTTGWISNEFGRMIVTDQGFLVEVDNPFLTIGLLVPEEIRASGQLLVECGKRHLKFRIKRIESEIDSKTTVSNSATVFLLSELYVHGRQACKGAQFSVRRADDRLVAVRFEKHVVWWYAEKSDMLDETAAYGELLSLDGKIKPNLLILEDINTWYKPQWSRITAYTVSSLDEWQQVQWMVSAPIALLLTWLFGIVLFCFHKRGFDNTSTSLRQLLLDGLPLAFFAFLRMGSLIVELWMWEQHLIVSLQRRWAATFHENAISASLLTHWKTPLHFTFVTHIPSFGIAVVLLVFWLFIGWDWMIYSFWSLMIEPFLRALGIEFLPVFTSYGLVFSPFTALFVLGFWRDIHWLMWIAGLLGLLAGFIIAPLTLIIALVHVNKGYEDSGNPDEILVTEDYIGNKRRIKRNLNKCPRPARLALKALDKLNRFDNLTRRLLEGYVIAKFREGYNKTIGFCNSARERMTGGSIRLS